MALVITHATVAGDPQDPLLGAAEWNAEHTITGLEDIVSKSDYSPAHSILVQQSGTGSPTALQIGNNTLVGRLSGGGSEINDLTGTQVTTLLDVFTTSLKGVVPASGGGTTNFLRADGTWAALVSGISGSAVIDFGSYGYATKVSVIDALVTATTKIMVSLASPAAGRDDDELEFNPICVAAIAKNGVGFDIYATAPIGADGQFNVNYTIGEY